MYIRNVETTGNSNWQADAYLIDLIRLYNPHSILDMGIGKWAKIGNLVRRSIDEWNYIHYGSAPLKIFGVEGYEANWEYVEKVYPNVYDVIWHGNFGELEENDETFYPKGFDIVVFADSLEHLTKSKAEELILKVIPKICKKAIIVQLPLGEYKQEVEINPLENHRSTWTPDEIIKLRPAGLRKFTDFAGRDFVVFSIPM